MHFSIKKYLIHCKLANTIIYWNYDYVMRLYPLPDLVVIADRQKAYSHTYSDCTVINPVRILK